MNIHGFQKTTLLDYPGKVACTVFTAGCNLRCPFCHNAFLVTEIDPSNRFEHSELLDYMKKRRTILDGVCITGGEPLLYADTLDFIKEIKDIGLSVKLDTNGSFPDRLKNAINSGMIDYIAMDIKNSPKKYPLTVGIVDFDISPIIESIELIRKSNIQHEFRTTVVKEFHNIEDFAEIGTLISGNEHYFLQNFVDSGNLISDGLSGVTPDEMRAFAAEAKKYVSDVEIRGI